MDSRAVTPVVEKTITMGIVVLFVGGMTTAMFGTAVPTYRDAVGTEMSERVLAMASEEIERTVPPNTTTVQSDRTVDLPATIRGSAYRIRVDGRSLVLVHPDIPTRRSRPALPPMVTGFSGEWQSGANTIVTVRSVSGGLAVELREGAP
ncbi:hypothetical protein SAMN05216559_0861 [Halomicrobium zhouii]|uniref:Uncharacterized protein n=1 Tax=Halomicrobium zhouii TaxID=767519 RepID=A0A1I6KIC2_9EURY|nr:hypothetical protein [Halomicrobium zhouii]SFR90973.1 hypothetical protein SAMN05216559_0861 [Halomicrobium zhouii]